MSVSEPSVIVTCNGKGGRCDDFEEVLMTPLVGGGFDLRDMDTSLRSAKWRVFGDKHYCPRCVAVLDEEDGA